MADCHHPTTGRETASEQRVHEVMVSRPKTLPASAAVADLQRLFQNEHVVTALLVDDRGAFVAAIDRDRLPAGADPAESAQVYAETAPQTIAAEAPMTAALERLDETGLRRLVVIDEETGLLRGLLCLASDRESFCR